jgi:hypothetical protein
MRAPVRIGRMPLSARTARLGLRAPLAAVALLAALAGSASAATSWTKISTVPLSGSTSVPALAVAGTTAVVTWEQETSPSTQSIISDTFQTSVAAPVAGGAPGTVASNWGEVSSLQALVPTPQGGVLIAYAGIHSLDTADPLNAMVEQQHQPDGSWSAPVPVASGASGEASTGVYGPAGPIFANNSTGAIYVVANPTVPPSLSAIDLQAPLPAGSDGYSPTLALDAMGRLWIAWYTSGPSNGVELQQLDPASGQPVAPAVQAPLSNDIDNNTLAGVALACASTCRVAYGVAPPGSSRDDVVTWAPGEAAPTTIASLAGTNETAGRVLAASYRSDGRLWLAWFNGKTFAYVLGDATGAHGTVQDAGAPVGGGGNTYAMRIKAVGDDLLMVAQFAGSDGALGMYVNTLAPPVPVAVAPGPRQTDLQTAPGGKGFRIQVQFRVPSACKPACMAHAEIRTRSGRQQYAVAVASATAPLPGDGKVVLGTRGSVKLPGGRKVRFYLTIVKAQLLRAPFHTVGANRIADTRLRVWLTTRSGQQLAVRDGRIAVSIARIRSGALPGLSGIL